MYTDDAAIKADVTKAVEAQRKLLTGLGLGKVTGMGGGGNGTEEAGPSAFDTAQRRLLEGLGYTSEDIDGMMDIKA
jgi:hypothetical protein